MKKQNLSFIFKIISLALIVGLVCTQVKKANHVSTGLPMISIDSVQATLLYDSTVSAKGNEVLQLVLEHCYSASGDEARAKGKVVAIGKLGAMISAGTKIRLYGSFSEGYFIFEEYQVINKTWINNMRERIMTFLEHRLDGSDANVLSMALLLGRTEDRDFEIKDLAMSCGCIHVLALSGMHVGLLALFCYTILGKNKVSRIISCLVVICFGFIVGNRPSVIRAVLAFLLFWVPVKKRVPLCLLVQAIIAPLTLNEMGFIYSYLAIAALVYIEPHLEGCTSQIYEGFGKTILSSVSVLILCAPVQIINDGSWCPIALIVSPIAAFLASLSMTLGLLILIAGQLPILTFVNEVIYKAMYFVLSYFKDSPAANWKGYVIFVCLAMCPVIINVFRCLFMHSKAKQNQGVIDLESVPNIEFQI